jgi:hypothetical protein
MRISWILQRNGGREKDLYDETLHMFLSSEFPVSEVFYSFRIFLAVTEEPEYRGLCVQQGGAKALILLALDGTPDGKLRAAQSLSRIVISINPEIAFPGQRVSNC